MKATQIIALCVLVLACSANSTNDNTQNEKEIVSFVYHRFADNRFPSTNISLRDFEAHLAYLKKNNYQVLTFSEAIAYLHSADPVKKTAVLTIDDGYKTFYSNGLPLLQKYNMPATLFINTETVGGNDYMDWQDLKNVTAAGIEIGNHTHSHAYFLNEEESTRYASFEREIKRSQQVIQEHLGIKPTVFAYPYGELDEKMKAIVMKGGFVAAAAQNSGVIYEGTDVFHCPRFPMSEAYADIKKFEEKVRMHPLRITKQDPTSFLAESNTPKLTLKFPEQHLNLERMQCFVQGGQCKSQIVSKENNEITLTLQAKSSIASRRRTLYTLTIPDSTGAWHWYSHLWINPSMK